jgi:hypothetical protein
MDRSGRGGWGSMMVMALWLAYGEGVGDSEEFSGRESLLID